MAKEEEAVVGSSTHGQWLSCPCKKCFRQHLNTIILVSPVKESDEVEIWMETWILSGSLKKFGGLEYHCFPNINVLRNHPGILVKCGFQFRKSGPGLEVPL